MSNRQGWIDVTRGTFVLAVVLTHVTASVSQVGGHPSRAILFVADLSQPFRMAVMFMIAGMFLQRALEKGARAYFGGRIRGILWPLALWFTIFVLAGLGLENYPSGSWSLRSLVSSYLWFFLFLFGIGVVAFLIRWVPAWYLIIPAFALAAVTADVTSSLKFFFYLGVYLVGHVIAQHRLLERPIFDRWQVLALTGPLIVITALWSSIHRPIGDAVYSPFILVTTFALLVTMRGLCRRFPVLASSRLLSTIGSHTVVIYLIHIPVQLLLVRLWQAWLVPPAPFMLLAGCVMPVVLSLAIIHLRPRSRIVDLAFEFPRPSSRTTAPVRATEVRSSFG